MPNCYTDTCSNGGTCQDLGGQYRCFCVGDYYGDSCSDCKNKLKNKIATFNTLHVIQHHEMHLQCIRRIRLCIAFITATKIFRSFTTVVIGC